MPPKELTQGCKEQISHPAFQFHATSASITSHSPEVKLNTNTQNETMRYLPNLFFQVI